LYFFAFLYQSRSLVLADLVLVLICTIKTTIGDTHVFIQRRRCASLLEGEPALDDHLVGHLVHRILLRGHSVCRCAQSNPVFWFSTRFLVRPARLDLRLSAADPDLRAEDEQTRSQV